MVIFFGLFASFLFLNGIFSQIKRIKERKMADDVSETTIWQWFVGLVILFVISLYTKAHWIFPVGYGAQSLACLYLVGLVIKYQKESEIQFKRIRDNVMKEVRNKDEFRVYDGGKN